MPLPGLMLRAATPADRAAIHRLVHEVFTGPDAMGLADSAIQAFQETASRLAGRIDRDLDWCVVAQHRTRTIGHISCWQDEMLGVVGSHAVTEAYRGFGVGSALLGCMVQRAREGGLRLLEASFGAERRRALHLYERHGFCRIGCTTPQGWTRCERRLDGPT